MVGPSGVGKGRLVKALLSDYTKFFQKVVTHTTRRPRPDEVNCSSYFFVTNSTFQQLETNGYFMESAQVHNNFYGTSFAAWEKVCHVGKISILEIDIVGAKSIHRNTKQLGLHPWYLFIAPPDLSFLRERLDRRGSETEEEKLLRLKNADIEIEEGKKLMKKEKKWTHVSKSQPTQSSPPSSPLNTTKNLLSSDYSHSDALALLNNHL